MFILKESVVIRYSDNTDGHISQKKHLKTIEKTIKAKAFFYGHDVNSIKQVWYQVLFLDIIT